jgi:hypothetical protein
MKQLLTLTALLLTFSGLAQQMPYNPDANGDDFVGVDDVLGVLGVYDTALMQPDLECDYEGTDLEQLVGGIVEGGIVLDSLYVEYLLLDTVLTYLPGCPDPVLIETVLERSYTFTSNYQIITGTDLFDTEMTLNFLGYSRRVQLRFNQVNGSYRFFISDNEVGGLTSYDALTYWAPADNSNTANLPFPDNWTLDENGIQVDWGQSWHNGWVEHCESFRLIPFWHEAE